jgi:hypothetical protein
MNFEQVNGDVNRVTIWRKIRRSPGSILELCGKMPKPLAEENKPEKVTLDELMVSTLAMSRCVSEADDLPSGIITDDEFKS